MEHAVLSIQHHRSSLFTIRVWREAPGRSLGEVRMEVRHVLSGETRYFREWAHLAAYLEGKLPAVNQTGKAQGGSMG
jgi:hypothetical protein